jgi:hypothetical protein
MAEGKDSGEPKFTTPFGILEEIFMRPVSKGDYTPTVNQFQKLLIDNEINHTQTRVLFFIKSKTIDFRDTHCRMKRRDIAASLNLDQANTFKAIKSLIEKSLLLEKKDSDNYYFYALNPVTFGGVIVLRNQSEVYHRINSREKQRLGIYGKSHGKNTSGLWQKAKAFMVKYHNEEILSIENHSAFEILKYIILKYIYQNSLSDLTANLIFKIAEESPHPASLLLQLVDLMHAQPMHGRGMIEELKRAYTLKTDCYNRPIKTNPIVYLVSCWDQAKIHWQNIQHNLDCTDQAKALRHELYEVIMNYPTPTTNVFQLKKGIS